MAAPSSASASSDELAHAKQHGQPQVQEKSLEPVARTNAVMEEVKLETETVQEAREREEGAVEYPASWRLAVILLALCLAVSLTQYLRSRLAGVTESSLTFQGLLHGFGQHYHRYSHS